MQVPPWAGGEGTQARTAEVSSENETEAAAVACAGRMGKERERLPFWNVFSVSLCLILFSDLLVSTAMSVAGRPTHSLALC